MPPKFAGSESDDDMPMDMEAVRGNYALRLCPAEYARLFVENLPEDKKTLVKGLQGNQNEIDALLIERAIAEEQLRISFEAKLAPLYTRRSAIVAGTAAPTPAEVAAAFEDDNVGAKELPADSPLASSTQFRAELALARAALVGKGAGLNAFWLEALRNHEFLSQLITEKDAAILESLVDISVVHFKAPRSGFAVRYVFGPNTAIKSANLVSKGPTADDVPSGPCPAAKAFLAKVIEAGATPADELTAGVVVPEGGVVLVKAYYHCFDQDGDMYAIAIDGTDIAWVEGQNPTVVLKEKKQTRGKGKAKQTRTVQYEEDVVSFFNIFKPVSTDDEGEDEESPFDRDHELARLVATSIVPRAIEWFTARAAGPSSPFGDEEDDEGMMMGGESDDEEGAPSAKPKVGGPPAAGQQECKQQ